MWRFALFAAVLCLSPCLGRAEEVEFNTAAASFPCRVKTPQDFAAANPDRKVIETSIRVSATFDINSDKVDRIEYKFNMPETFEIFDYLPTTKIGSEFATHIGVGIQTSKRSLTIVSLDAGARAGFRIPIEANASLKNEQSDEVVSNVQMNLLPPKRLITSASTQNAGRTLHFKLKQFSQDTLEGDKDFAFLMAVPKEWRGDCSTLECSAYIKGSPEAIKKTIKIGMYILGDIKSKKRVESLVEDEKTTQLEKDEASKSKNEEEVLVPESAKKYVGRYTMDDGNWHYEFNLREDGTWTGVHAGPLNVFRHPNEGPWGVTNRNKLYIRQTEIRNAIDSTPDRRPKNIIFAKIIFFDPDQHIIKTDDGDVLRPLDP